jgi:hypothetical protein
MVQQLLQPDQSELDTSLDTATTAWKTALRRELDQTFARGNGRWSRAFIILGLLHLAAFIICHNLHSPRQESDPRHIGVWFCELVSVFVVMRLVVGKGWFWSPPAIHFIGRLWLTLLILSFSLSTLNAAIGWQTLWFKAAWGTLGSFFFATLAWLITPRFLFLAVQMYVTALLMSRFMEWNNVIYGVSWCLALWEIAWAVRKREKAGFDDR